MATPQPSQTGWKSHPAGGRDSQEDEEHEEGQHRACEEENEEEEGWDDSERGRAGSEQRAIDAVGARQMRSPTGKAPHRRTRGVWMVRGADGEGCNKNGQENEF